MSIFIREVLVFLIRGFGGEVSWDSTLAIGSTYSEDDSKITHQIVDRPAIQKQVLTRTYVQVIGRISAFLWASPLMFDT